MNPMMQSSYSWIEADRKLFSPYLKLFRGVVKALDSIFFVGGEDWGGGEGGVYVEYSMVLIGLIVSLGFHRIEGGGSMHGCQNQGKKIQNMNPLKYL